MFNAFFSNISNTAQNKNNLLQNFRQREVQRFNENTIVHFRPSLITNSTHLAARFLLKATKTLSLNIHSFRKIFDKHFTNYQGINSDD